MSTTIADPANHSGPLAVGMPVQGRLERGNGSEYSLDLPVQAVALLTLENERLCGGLTIVDPAGQPVRSWIVDCDGKRQVAFVADLAGEYRVQLTAGASAGSYRLTLDQTVSLAERIKPLAQPRLESNRIKRLRTELLARPEQALTAFWQEVAAQGTPLLEADPDNPQLTLCTFLWHGQEQLHHVRVHLLFRTTLPNDYRLTRIEGTDIWFTTIRLPSQGRFAYTMLVNPPLRTQPDIDSDPEHKLLYFAGSQVDPLNPRHCFAEGGSRYETWSLLELADAPPQPWTARRPDVAEGALRRMTFKSALLQDERLITVYTPSGYSKQAKPYGLLLVFDAQWYLSRVPTPTILDNLIAAAVIPPLVAVIIGNGPGDARSRQLPCNPAFADFIANELLPWVRRHYHVTRKPDRTIVTGASYGGLAATYLGLQHPEQFGNVLAQSGSYWWQPSEQLQQAIAANRHPERNYLAALVIQRPKLALRFYLTAGSGEIDRTGNGHSILTANRHLRDVLLAKGYEVHYREFVGGHDFLSWRGSLAEGLIVLTADWTDSTQPSP